MDKELTDGESWKAIKNSAVKLEYCFLCEHMTFSMYMYIRSDIEIDIALFSCVCVQMYVYIHMHIHLYIFSR